MKRYSEIDVGDSTYKVEFSAWSFHVAERQKDIDATELINGLQSGENGVFDNIDLFYIGILHHQPDVSKKEFFKSLHMGDIAKFIQPMKEQFQMDNIPDVPEVDPKEVGKDK